MCYEDSYNEIISLLNFVSMPRKPNTNIKYSRWLRSTLHCFTYANQFTFEYNFNVTPDHVNLLR